VTADQVGDGPLDLLCTVNGEVRQRASTADLIFDIPTIIATLSAGMTLQPGDVIATGTPAGVGIGFTPPRFLRGGDVVEITITGLGTLTNRVGGVA
jgi:2-keto-4-pentenoate hydratase/2-oxohepta-3-ene-1,7-dioic acid hydratase in catechol pathway